MALARLGLKQLQRRVISPNSGAAAFTSSPNSVWNRGYSDSATPEKGGSAERPSSSDGREVAVSEGGKKKSKLFSKKGNKRGLNLWRNRGRDFVPALHEFFPSGLGNAIMQATENMNRLLENLAPSRLMGQVREKDECYQLRYEVPGLAKEDVKITVEDGVLRIKAEHREEKEDEGSSSDDEHWTSTSYGYYDATVVLPDDAKADEIKAEMKNGVLYVTVPRAEKLKRDVTEVQIQ